MKMSKEEIFAIIDDELEKRKDNTFLLWDFPNDVKKRIEELYQSIDNANPSEALEETLRDIAYDLENDDNPFLRDRYYGLLDLKQSIIKSQEQEKVLEIIKEKGVDVATFNTYQSVIEYNWNIRFEKHKRKELTEEEFELLKRYFK